MLAQSIGGGGGNGAITLTGSTNGSITGTDLDVGGFNSGGTQGSMGTVTVNISGGSITTTGDLAYGLLAQAIGGGGGNAALVAQDPLAINGDPTLQAGSNGSTGGSGSAINTTNSNNFSMSGLGSIGQVQQSIGGGGGTPAMAGNFVFSATPFNAYVGGNSSGGALSGDGGIVQYGNTGTTATTGDNAIGILVGSIGGGGGLETFTFSNTTSGTGITNVTEVVGGSQASAGAGSAVMIPTFSGPISTQGQLSEGVLVQSIGGGGGLASFVVNSPLGFSVNSGGLSLAAGSNTLAGSTGGVGGQGDAVTMTSTASVTTSGTGALGVIVQSIGGGGGVAQEYGATVSGTNTAILGAAGSATGTGGTVMLSSGGIISTTGTGAHGILAQSIGGGGGFIQAFDQNGTPLNLAVSAGGGGSGSGGAVSVSNTGAISTMGAGAYGIIAQSIGGGGGLVGGGAFATSLTTTGPFAGTAGGAGSGNTVGISTSANISATGLNSTAIFGESAGGSGAGTITVSVTSGVVVTGGYVSGSPIPVAGNAIALAGGFNNTITNSGTLTTVSGTNGMAITGGGGGNAVVNNGLTIGSIDLCLNGGCNGVNSFDNAMTGTNITDTVCTARGGTNCTFAGAIFDPGITVDLGDYHTAGNLLSNEGLISPGGTSMCSRPRSPAISRNRVPAFTELISILSIRPPTASTSPAPLTSSATSHSTS